MLEIAKGNALKFKKRIRSLMIDKSIFMQMKQDIIADLTYLASELNMLSKFESIGSSTSKWSPIKAISITEFTDSEVYNLDQNPLVIELLNVSLVGYFVLIE